MLYLAGQLWLFLLLALVVGIFTGWLTCKPR
jgi:uncharacterized membrane-anchored protein YhcB (DUF1043 family)